MAEQIVQKDYELKIVKVEELIPYENNPRQITQDAINQVKNSIKQNNFSSVIVVNKDMVIIAGHTRLLAAKELGYKELPVMVTKNIDEKAEKRLRLLDNRLTELTPWDIEKLVDETYAADLDEDFTKLFQPLLNQDLSEFDLSDDNYEGEQSEKYGNAIIQYVMIFDNEEQQQNWYAFIAKMREKYPKEETHAARINKFIKDFID